MASTSHPTTALAVLLLVLGAAAGSVGCGGSGDGNGSEGANENGDTGSAATKVLPELPDELDFALPTIDGRELRLEDALDDGPVILDFWATWCAPCKRAMPAWEALAERYAEHGVQLWAVSWDHPRMHAKIGPYFERAGFDFPALLDADKKVGRGLGVANLPTTFLIAPDGSIAWKHVGYADGDEKELEARLREVLGLDS